MLISKKGRNIAGKHQLHKIAIEDLKQNNHDNTELIDKTNKSILLYLYDDNFQRIITTELSKDGEKILLKWRGLRNKKWQRLFAYESKDYKITPVGFISQNTLAVLSNKETDKMALQEFDIKTQQLGKILFQHPLYDLIDADFNIDGILTSVHFIQHGVHTKQYFDQDIKKFSARLKKTFKGKSTFIIGKDKSQNIILLYTSASDSPGKLYIYNKSKDIIKRLYNASPDLKKYTFSKTMPIKVKSADGTQLEAFLTRPSGLDHKTLLVMPHGGPIGIQETDDFDPAIQYLVNRGFSILRVNFRGSSGYGKAFLEQGVGQFGQLIEQDISAAVSNITSNLQFDNICSIGSSYGGYSSVMLAMKHPKIYDCVVAAFGIYDLPLLFNSSNFRSGKEHHDFIAKVVGELDDSHKTLSPVYSAHKLKAPLLLIAGKEDDISGIEQSNRFKYVLNKLDHDVETLFYGGTGHGHTSWWGERHQVAAIVDFLNRKLSLNSDKKSEFIEDKVAISKDFEILADALNFEGKVENNQERAFDYYKKAAELGNARAIFNIGSHYHRGQFVEKNIDTAIEYYVKSAELG